MSEKDRTQEAPDPSAAGETEHDPETTEEGSHLPAISNGWSDGPAWGDVALETTDGRPSGFVIGRVVVLKQGTARGKPFPPDQDTLNDLHLGIVRRDDVSASAPFVVLEASSRDGADAEWTKDAVAQLRDRGYRAQVDHVFFVDQSDDPRFTANPFTANPFTANPFTANPFTANPFTANPFTANPFTANPFTANASDTNRWPRTTKADSTGVPRNTARPSPRGSRIDPPQPGREVSLRPRVLVLDTGLPNPGRVAHDSQQWLAQLHATSNAPADELAIDAVTRTTEEKRDNTPAYWLSDRFDSDGDGSLDPASGHGVFIASIIDRIAPDSDITVVRVVRHLGLALESEIAAVLEWAAELAESDKGFDIISLSFSAYDVPEDAYDLISNAVHAVQQAGAVVVASAGNEAVWEAPIPAALHGVIAVAALDEHENAPAWFTNYGPWVDACAPGSAIEGEFWDEDRGERVWRGRALWSGTSFAAPYVAGAIARTLWRQRLDDPDFGPRQAAGMLLDDRRRGTIPWHGRVIRGF